MKAGGDKDGVWTLLESAILCVQYLHRVHRFSSDSPPQCLCHHRTHPIRPAHFIHFHRKERGANASPGVRQRTCFTALGSWCKQKGLILPLGTPIRQSPTCSPRSGLFQSGEELPEAERPSVNDVAEDGGLAIIAGSDTTSSVLTALLYYLLFNPEAYKHLQEEVDSAFTIGEEPLDTAKLSHMEWLNGCMCVTM